MRLKFGPLWLMRHAPRLLAITLLSLFAASLAWQAVALLKLRDTPTSETFQPVIAAEQPIDPSAIAQLFAPQSADIPHSASQQIGDLTLHGSFVHPAPEKSSALIAKQGAPASRYHLNSPLDEHTRVQAIYRDHVVLERNGRTEYLRFPATARSSAVDDEEAALALKTQMMEQLREQMEATSDQALLPVSQTAMDSELP